MADITGTAGDDSLVGTQGDDVFEFSLGNDTLMAGAGYDALIVGTGFGSLENPFPAGTIVDLALGTIQAPGLLQAISGFEEVEDNTRGATTLRGDDLDNVLSSRGDGGVLEGRGGRDVLIASGGTAMMSGGDGNDQFQVSTHENLLVSGGEGLDVIWVGIDERQGLTNRLKFGTNTEGQDVLFWEYYETTSKFSVVTVLDSVERIWDGQGLSYDYAELRAEHVSDDAIIGTMLGSVLTGTGGDDTVLGLGGNDWILATTGSDTIDGGTGIDMLSYVGQSKVTLNLGTGNVWINDYPHPTTEQHQISGIENVTGTSGNDHITGDEGTNYLRGLGGRDIFQGSGGGDLINGGGGTDTLLWNPFLADQFGQPDQYISLLRGRVWEGEAAGTRLVNIENITAGSGDDRLTGDHGANRLDGWNGNDTLMGNGGDDLLYGGLGDDLALYGFDQDQYAITTRENGVTEVAYIGASTGDGTDLLVSIETLRFADGDLVL